MNTVGNRQISFEINGFLGQNVLVKRRKRNDELAMAIGKRIKALMLKRGFKRNALAKKASIAATTLWDYMAGESIPGPEVLLTLAKLLDVSIDWLMKGEYPQGLPFTDDALRVAEQYDSFVARRPEETERVMKTIDALTEGGQQNEVFRGKGGAVQEKGKKKKRHRAA